MTELELALVELGRALELPPAPDLTARVAARIEPRRRGFPVRRLAIAAAVLAVAIGIAFAVPPARSAILRFLGFGAVRIELVQTLPAAQERPLGAGLGDVATAAQARAVLHGRLLLPPGASHATFRIGPGGVVSVVLRSKYGLVLLSELPFGDVGVLKKVSGEATKIEGLEVDGHPGLWLTGAPHVFMFPGAPPRLAGNVLIWQRSGFTLRLEGRLTKAQAVELARSVG
jgi:hypothetical protein